LFLLLSSFFFLLSSFFFRYKVAINTQGSSLLTLLISNNFVELKASVFKRFQPENLFQITCSDIVERFHLFIFMGMIGLQNLQKEEDRNIFLKAAPIILGCEFLVDWIKHCFVSNFNRIPLTVYAKFTAVLRHDMTSGIHGSGSSGGGSGDGGNGTNNRDNNSTHNNTAVSSPGASPSTTQPRTPPPVTLHGKATRNHAYRVASRIGLLNLPLAVAVVRVLLTQFAYQNPAYTTLQLQIVIGMMYLCLLAFKMLLGLCLMSHAAWEFNKKVGHDKVNQISKNEKVLLDCVVQLMFVLFLFPFG
jgi:hypothetical protein